MYPAILRPLSLLALCALLAGCTSHSTTPAPAMPDEAAPNILQKQPLPSDNWVTTFIKTIDGHVADPSFLTSDKHGNIWAGTYNSITEVTMGGNEKSFPLTIVPYAIAAGPDGNLWVTSDIGVVAKVTPSGAETDYTVATNDGRLNWTGIATGSDGALWFTECDSGPPVVGNLGRITTEGTYSSFSLGAVCPQALVSGPDGDLWVLAEQQLLKVSTLGAVSGTYEITSGEIGGTQNLVVGADRNLWVGNPDNLARVTTSGTVTEYTAPSGDILLGIAQGSDGNMWSLGFTVDNGYNLTAFNPTSQTYATPIVAAPRQPDNIISGMDGNLWVDASANNVATYLLRAMTASPTSLTISGIGQNGSIAMSETNYTGRFHGSTSNAAVATASKVSANGAITVSAVGAGTAIIKISDNANNTVRVKVTVQ